MPNAEIIGAIAAVLTTASFVPQVVKIVRERQTAGISLLMYSLFTVGVGLWMIFGIIINSPSVYVANGITLMLATIVLVMKIRLG